VPIATNVLLANIPILIFQAAHACALMGIIKMEVPAVLALGPVPLVRQLALTVIVVSQHLNMHQVVSVIVIMVIIEMVQIAQLVPHHVPHVKQVRQIVLVVLTQMQQLQEESALVTLAI
jgi:hypothetical protein